MQHLLKLRGLGGLCRKSYVIELSLMFLVHQLCARVHKSLHASRPSQSCSGRTIASLHLNYCYFVS